MNAKMEVTAAEVLAAARGYLRGDGAAEPWLEISWPMLSVLAHLAGVSDKQQTAQERQAWERFTAQVRRALDKLAEEGTLRKVKRGGALPGGRTAWASLYLTPDAYQRAETRAREQQAADEAADARWTAIQGRLKALGLAPHRCLVHRIALEADAWEKLLERAEAGVSLATAVRFAHPDAGYEGDQENARTAGLVPGQVHALRSMHVGQSSTYIELLEVPGVRFNSVMFEPCGDTGRS